MTIHRIDFCLYFRFSASLRYYWFRSASLTLFQFAYQIRPEASRSWGMAGPFFPFLVGARLNRSKRLSDFACLSS